MPACRFAGDAEIRGGANREVLKSIKETGDIFFAESDRDWILAGAAVNVSMIGFDNGTERERFLDGKTVPTINSNLSAASDITKALPLRENSHSGFIGSCKGGAFDIAEAEALELLRANGNPHGLPNSDLVRPVANSKDLTVERGQRWIIDTRDLPLDQATRYAGPFAIVVERVKPHRDTNRDKWLKQNWWRPQRMRPEMRSAIQPIARFIVTPTTSKHRVFIWLVHPVLPDHKLVVIARADDSFLEFFIHAFMNFGRRQSERNCENVRADLITMWRLRLKLFHFRARRPRRKPPLPPPPKS